jgi:hypothetical protein
LGCEALSRSQRILCCGATDHGMAKHGYWVREFVPYPFGMTILPKMYWTVVSFQTMLTIHTATLDVTLKVAGVGESVTVTTEAPPVETSRTEISQ